MTNQNLGRLIMGASSILMLSMFLALAASGADNKTNAQRQWMRDKAEDELLRSRSVKICAYFDSGPMKCGTGFYNRRNSIVTQYHILSPLPAAASLVGPSHIMVLTHGATEFVDAVLVSSEPVHDFATLYIPTPGPKTILWDNFKLGDKVTIIGNPAGRDFEVARLKVSGVHPMKLLDGTFQNMILIDNTGLRLRPGYSGGGVFTDGENLIGTVEMCYDSTETCLAIPTSDIRRQIERSK